MSAGAEQGNRRIPASRNHCLPPFLSRFLSLLLVAPITLAGPEFDPVNPGDPESSPGSEVTCTLGAMAPTEDPGRARIGLYRTRSDACSELILDTGLPVGALNESARARLDRSSPGFSCAVVRPVGSPADWELFLAQETLPAFRGELLLHQGRPAEALAVFAEGLPGVQAEAWLAAASRNLPQSVARILPPLLAEADPDRAGSAIRVLEALVASHPTLAHPVVMGALESPARADDPAMMSVAAEEAAGLRLADPRSPDRGRLERFVREGLRHPNPAVRSAAALALPLAVAEESDAVRPLAEAAGREPDPATRVVLLEMLAETGGAPALRRLSASVPPAARSDLMRILSRFPDSESGRPDPLLELLEAREAGAGEILRRLSARPGPLRERRWGEILPSLGDGLSEEERALVPAIACRVEEGSGGNRAAELLRRLAREESSAASIEALRALRRCGADEAGDSLRLSLDLLQDSGRSVDARIAAAQAGADLARTGEQATRFLAALETQLDSSGPGARQVGIAGLIEFGIRRDPYRAALPLVTRATAGSTGGEPRDLEPALRRLEETAPGSVARAIRKVAEGGTDAGRLALGELYQRLAPENLERALARLRAECEAGGESVPAPTLAEMRSRVDVWPIEIFELVRPRFASAREEERFRLLPLMVDLGRNLPEQVLELLPAPADASDRVRAATAEAMAATLARRTALRNESRPEELMSMALEPLDADRRAAGRQGLWLLARENPIWRSWVLGWLRERRRESVLPLRVELGRLASQVQEMGIRKSLEWPEERSEANRKRAALSPPLPGISPDSEAAPAALPPPGGGSGSDLRGGGC